MDPFVIYCATCSARIKVRHASAVGEIHACPKCGSMVLIERPSESQRRRSEQSAAARSQSTPPPVAASQLDDSFDEVDTILGPDDSTRSAPTRAAALPAASGVTILGSRAPVSTASVGDSATSSSPSPDQAPVTLRWTAIVLAAVAGASLAFGAYQLWSKTSDSQGANGTPDAMAPAEQSPGLQP